VLVLFGDVSLAVSLGDDGPFAPVSGPALSGGSSWLLSSTQGEALQGNHEASHRLDVATVGVRGVLDREAVHQILDDADRLLTTEAALRLPERAVPLPTARR